MKVNIERYNSIKQLLDTIEARPVNEVFKNKTQSTTVEVDQSIKDAEE